MSRIRKILKDIQKDDFLYCNTALKIVENNIIKFALSNSYLMEFVVIVKVNSVELNYSKNYRKCHNKILETIDNKCVINEIKTIIKEHMIIKNIIWAELKKIDFFINNNNIVRKYFMPENLEGTELHIVLSGGKLRGITMEYEETTYMVQYVCGHTDKDFSGKVLLRDVTGGIKKLIENDLSNQQICRTSGLSNTSICRTSGLLNTSICRTGGLPNTSVCKANDKISISKPKDLKLEDNKISISKPKDLKLEDNKISISKPKANKTADGKLPNVRIKRNKKNHGIVILESEEDIKKMEKFLLILNKSVDLPDETSNKSVDLPDVSSNKSVDLPDVSSNKSVDLPDVSSNKSVDLPDVSSNKSVDLPDIKKEKEVKIEDFFDINVEKNECRLKIGFKFYDKKLCAIENYDKNEYYLTAAGLYYKNDGNKKSACEFFKKGHELGYKMCKVQLIKMYTDDGKFNELSYMLNI